MEGNVKHLQLIDHIRHAVFCGSPKETIMPQDYQPHASERFGHISKCDPMAQRKDCTLASNVTITLDRHDSSNNLPASLVSQKPAVY